jgi:hypothetical protein
VHMPFRMDELRYSPGRLDPKLPRLRWRGQRTDVSSKDNTSFC